MHLTATNPATAPPHPSGLFQSAGQRTMICSLFLFGLTLLLYDPASLNGFINFDDDRYVTENPEVQAGLHWHTISWSFTSTEQANWHPLTWLSHALDCQLFHLNPTGHHNTSVLLHAANVVLLFLILHWFTASLPRSLMVAALFAVHPLNVESVAWVAERKTVLCMFFLLLALAAYGWYVQKPGLARYLLVAVTFALALMAKPMAITFPLLLLLLDYWPLQRLRIFGSADLGSSDATKIPHFTGNSRTLWQCCLEKLPLLGLAAASATVTIFAQRSGGALLVTNVQRGWPLRLENVVVSYAAYVSKAIWPSPLAILYPFPHALPGWKIVLAFVFLLAITIAVINYRSRRYLLTGWLWYLLSMLPMIGLIQVGNQSMADRYAYLPAIGLFLIASWGMADLAAAKKIANREARALERIVATSGVLVIIAFALVTRAQIKYWHDDFSLWSHTLSVTHDNFVAEDSLGQALVKQNHTDEAISHFRTAAQIEPGDAVSQLNLGIYAQERGDLQEAIIRYNRVPNLTVDDQLRASAYANLGTVYFQLQNYEEARRNFEFATRWKRVFPIALLDLGIMAEREAKSTEDWQRAAANYARFVEVNPSDVGYMLLSHSLHQAGREEEAKKAHGQAQRLSKNLAQAEQKAEQLVGHHF